MDFFTAGFLRGSMRLTYFESLQHRNRGGSAAKSDHGPPFPTEHLSALVPCGSPLGNTALRSLPRGLLLPDARTESRTQQGSSFQSFSTSSGPWYPPFCLPSFLFPHDSSVLYTFGGFFPSILSQGTSLLVTPKCLQ